MIANLDGDLVAFRCAASVGDLGEEEIAILRTDKLMRDLLYNTDSESYRCFISGRGNFRKILNPDYKANRKDKPPPKWLQSCREYLTKEWNAILCTGREADDDLGINQQEDSICVSLDKDLRMIPGWHFNWLQNEKSYVTPLGGIQHFYKQMLIGDKTDNIFGVAGIGQVKASKLIEPLETEQEMLDIVLGLYDNDCKRFLMNANCLWIMQKENEVWQQRVDLSILPDQLKQELEMTVDSMRSLMEGISMGLGMKSLTTCGILNNGELMVESPQILEMT